MLTQVWNRVAGLFKKKNCGASTDREKPVFSVIVIDPRNFQVRTLRRTRLSWFLERLIFHRKCKL